MRLGAALFNFVEPRARRTVVASDSGVWLEREALTQFKKNKLVGSDGLFTIGDLGAAA